MPENKKSKKKKSKAVYEDSKNTFSSIIKSKVKILFGETLGGNETVFIFKF